DGRNGALQLPRALPVEFKADDLIARLRQTGRDHGSLMPKAADADFHHNPFSRPKPCNASRLLRMDSIGPKSAAGACHNDPGGPHQNLEVEPEGPVVDIFQVHSHPFVEIVDFVASPDL